MKNSKFKILGIGGGKCGVFPADFHLPITGETISKFCLKTGKLETCRKAIKELEEKPEKDD